MAKLVSPAKLYHYRSPCGAQWEQGKGGEVGVLGNEIEEGRRGKEVKTNVSNLGRVRDCSYDGLPSLLGLYNLQAGLFLGLSKNMPCFFCKTL
jgi:hypothetical protein